MARRREHRVMFAQYLIMQSRRRLEGHRRRCIEMRKRISKRKMMLLVAIMTALSLFGSEMFAISPRSVWTYPRSSRWWEDIVLNSFSHYDWMENFRMSKATFTYLCDQLRPIIKKKNTRMRRPIAVEHRVTITLWVLATTSEYRSIAHHFGIARNTVCVIVHETCLAIVKKLLPLYVQFPTGDGLKHVIDGFQEKWALPQCGGSIDGSHISITPPKMNHTDYYNRKGFYSMLVQAVVDHDYLFRNLCIGWPGSVHDARVFANSSLHTKVMNGELLQGDHINVNGQKLLPYLVGDSAYPLLPWLIKPFSFTTALTNQEKEFNYRISRGRVVVEIAFGQLKGRWRRLCKQIDMNIDNVPYIIAACCVLHNMCEIH